MDNVNFDKEKELIFNEAICKNMKGHYTGALDKVKEELDKIPLANATAEVIDARGGKATLGEKVREISSDLESIVHLIEPTTTTDEIQIIFNNSKKILWKSGEYLIDRQLNINNPITIDFEEGVTLKATTEMYTVLYSNKNSGITLKGSNTLIDLNDKSDSAIIIQSDVGDTKENIVVSGFISKNRPLTSRKYVSAFTVRCCKNIYMKNLNVCDYGYNNVVNNEVYGIGLHYCSNVNIKSFACDNVYIGICFEETSNVNIDNFALTDIKDNGLYPLTNCKLITAKNGSIINAEEGVGNHSSDLMLDNVLFENCTNKAITLREGDNIKIINSTFRNNNVDIGDNASSLNTNVFISHNLFKNSTQYSIYTRTMSFSKITHNNFFKDIATYDIIRIADINANTGNNVDIVNNTITVNSNTQSAICFNPYVGGCNYCTASNNTLINGSVGLKAYRATGGTGGEYLYFMKNIFRDITLNYALSGSLLNIKKDDWV